MANQPRTNDDTPRDRADEHTPKREGDVLGLSDADPAVEIPRATEDRGGNPTGIEVGSAATGGGELTRSKGATGIDMGAGGTGTDIDPSGTRPSRSESVE